MAKKGDLRRDAPDLVLAERITGVIIDCKYKI